MLINKRKIIILVSSILLAISTYSYGTDTGVITGETVKLRQVASLEAKLVTLLSVNDKVEVLGQEGDWYKVKYKENTGYVYKDYVKVQKTEVTTTEQVENTVTKNKVEEKPVIENNIDNSQTTENTKTSEIIVP